MMKALILNSGLGSRMGDLTRNKPKCMVELSEGTAIIDLQLWHLAACGIKNVVITTGPFADRLEAHVRSRHPEMDVTFVNNPIYDKTNYIYSIALAQEHIENQELVLLHGDLVFDRTLLRDMLASGRSCMAVDPSLPLPEKDFKAVLSEDRIQKIGIEFFEQAAAAQPLYYFLPEDWNRWLREILHFCGQGIRGVYAENAFNACASEVRLFAFDAGGRLCAEVDNQDDLEHIKKEV